MPTRLQSFAALGNYDKRIRAAIAAGHHHYQRRATLVELLRDGFGLTVHSVFPGRHVRA